MSRRKSEGGNGHAVCQRVLLNLRPSNLRRSQLAPAPEQDRDEGEQVNASLPFFHSSIEIAARFFNSRFKYSQEKMQKVSSKETPEGNASQTHEVCRFFLYTVAVPLNW